MSCPFFRSRNFEIPCGNRTVNFASISSYDIVFPSNVIGTEVNGAFVLVNNKKYESSQSNIYMYK